MRRCGACVLLITLAVGGMAAAAARPQPVDLTIEKYAISADRFEGILAGPVPGEWSGNVTVTGGGAKATCDRLKVWLAADGRHIERAEAAGHIVIHGRYLAADKTEWRIVGKGDSARYERDSGQGTLKGSVEFSATNQATGTVISLTAEELVYDIQTRHFRFERGDKQVHGLLQGPEAEGKTTAGPEEPPSGNGESD